MYNVNRSGENIASVEEYNIGWNVLSPHPKTGAEFFVSNVKKDTPKLCKVTKFRKIEKNFAKIGKFCPSRSLLYMKPKKGG